MSRFDSNAASPAGAHRRRQLALIHMAKKALGLDDEVYRETLRRLTGFSSAADLDEAGRDQVIRYMKRQGFAPPDRKRAGPQEAMILGLWDELRRIGAFRHGDHASLDSFMSRIGVQVAHPRFCAPAQANKVIEALKSWLNREKRRRGLG